jgi:FAD/FMN-containing dehydrogenase
LSGARGAGADLEQELRACAAGDVHLGPGATARWTSDFGRMRTVAPLAVVEAESEDDVTRVLAFARSRGLPVTVRGSGHSCNGQTLGAGIVLVNRVQGATPVTILPGGLAEVPAGARWREVERTLNRAGLDVPVLADYLDLSVGGTLSVGCYGVDSIVHGAQVDLVERLRVVRPDGSSLWCSRTENQELFRWSLAGLGQLGVVVRAVIRTRRRRRVTALFTRRHASFGELVDGLGRLSGAGADDPALFKALDSRGRVRSTVGWYFDGWREALAAKPPIAFGEGSSVRRIVSARYRFWRSVTVSLWLARFGGRGRIWADYLFDADALRPFAAELARLRAANAFARCLEAVYLVAVRGAGNGFPLEAASAPAGALRFGVGLYCMVPRHDESIAAAVRDALDRCLERCLDLGGRPYLYGAHRLDAARMHRIYGADYDRLRALRREGDPLGLFQPDTLP